VIAVLLLINGKRARITILAIIIIIVALALFATQSERFSRFLDLHEGTNFFRIRVWQSALQIIEDHPITGLGLDQFLYAFRGRYMLPDAWQEPNLSHPHNFVFDWWTRLGIFGVIVFAWLQNAFWQRGTKLYHAARVDNPLTLAIIIGALGSMVNLLAHGLVDNSVYVNDLALIFVLITGIASCLRTSELLTNPLK
jgi:O-antigen ligase